ncbi:MAG: phosphopantothenoylcysteine decarboxylase, partial [Rothia sp. (in: high G+C Gram-positive bacteria)]|nr:phosphopantothenoylcysteine decarboxylase [Rothia sp. (in: high G+C Gram-positive bacteria)]
VVITAGGTREAIDPVRFLGNRSSGKQGFALASAAKKLGANVHLIAAHVEVDVPKGLDEITRVSSAIELREATLAATAGADVLVMAAAVADFRPANYTDVKIKKKEEPSEDPVIQLVRNPDILREAVELRHTNPSETAKVIVGFAAETGDATTSPLAYGKAKLERKGCDFLAINTVSATQGFGSDRNKLTVLSHNSEVETLTVEGSKDDVSYALLRHIADYLNNL